MKNTKTLQEIADHFGVTYTTVSNWVGQGLKFETKRKIGKKPFKVTTIKNVESFLKQR